MNDLSRFNGLNGLLIENEKCLTCGFREPDLY